METYIATVMPLGKHRGQLLTALPTTFLFWWLSQDAIRAKHRETAKAALAILRDRLADLDEVQAEVLPEGLELVVWPVVPTLELHLI